MSVWRTEEIMRLGIRVCSLKSLWHQHSILLTSVMDKPSLVHNLTSRLTHTPLTGTTVTPVRFYSQERIHNLSSLAPAEVQPPTSEHHQRFSPLLTHLQRCVSPSDVLDLTFLYAPTPHEISRSITQMWFCVKKMTEEQWRYELQLMFQHPALEPLLQKAMKSASKMGTRDLAYSLFSMIKLGVPQRSRVIQTFLRSCQEKLNSFDEKGLSIVSSCLHEMEDDPNVSALKHGIRLVAEDQLSKIQSVVALQTMMRLLGKSATRKFKQELEEKALSMQDQFSLPNSVYMLSTMATINLRSKPLLEVCANKIQGNLDTITFNALYRVLRSCWELQYRDTALFTDISDYLATVVNIWTNKQLIFCLYMFGNLRFCPDAFMEAFAKQVIVHSDALTLKDILCILKVYSSLNYDLQHQRQQFLESLSHAVESYLPKMSTTDLLKVVYSLCLLNHFPPAPLELLLQENSLELLKATPSKILKSPDRMLRTVDLCLRLDRPQLPRPLTVPSSALGDSALFQPGATLCLSEHLQEVMEAQPGAELQEAVMVENFYFVDAVITKPVTEGGDDSPAERSHRIALLSTPSSHLCFGTSQLCGHLAAKIRHLRILGYDPVIFLEQKLNVLPQEKRTEFLRELIFPQHQGSEEEQQES